MLIYTKISLARQFIIRICVSGTKRIRSCDELIVLNNNIFYTVLSSWEHKDQEGSNEAQEEVFWLNPDHQRAQDEIPRASDENKLQLDYPNHQSLAKQKETMNLTSDESYDNNTTSHSKEESPEEQETRRMVIWIVVIIFVVS